MLTTTSTSSLQNSSQRLKAARSRFRELRGRIFSREKLHKVPSEEMSEGPPEEMDWSPPPSPSSASQSSTASMMDGTMDVPYSNHRKVHTPTRHVSAIFVHAGAGYHSVNNEKYHLRACDSAARAAMIVLKAGGSAVAAVEAAIQVLEDTDVTNAGFGSNLTIDGVVEGDATIVDHLGRSGACGAVSMIKNPIKLARRILDGTNKELSLRRVPPNLLVGQGATDFGKEHGLSLTNIDGNISNNSKDRWLRWQEELQRAMISEPTSPIALPAWADQEKTDPRFIQFEKRRDHTNALLTGTWNEGQPDSPLTTPRAESESDDILTTRLQPYIPKFGDLSPQASGASSPERVTMLRSSPLNTSMTMNRRPAPVNPKVPQNTSTSTPRAKELGSNSHGNKPSVTQTTQNEGKDGSSSPPLNPSHSDPATIIRAVVERLSGRTHSMTCSTPSSTSPKDKIEGEDHITDTVGAIAIDSFGCIAAGSSSGGIGMKHRGRVGPAALVGVGTAVIPENDNDDELSSVATCTSGTGEHMATTMAAQKCAQRIYELTKRTRVGTYVDITEEEAMSHFVKNDFMGHAGVRESHSPGAIGVMAVKKSLHGYFLYFAHNTESFALASMHSNETRPRCVMSRLGDTRNENTVVQGGRKIPIR